MAADGGIRVHERTRRPLPELGLALGGALTTGMAAYHAFLPTVFHWDLALQRMPMLRWGLTFINASFSYLLFAAGVITVVVGLDPRHNNGAARLLIGAVALYWLLNGLGQVLMPMPLPGVLRSLRWGFLGFSLSVALLYVSALVPGRGTGADAPAGLRRGRGVEPAPAPQGRP